MPVSFSRQTTQTDPMGDVFNMSINKRAPVRVISSQSRGRLETTLPRAPPNDFGSNYAIITGDPYPLAAFFDGHHCNLVIIWIVSVSYIHYASLWPNE